MKKIILMFVILTSIMHAANSGAPFKNTFKYQEPSIIHNDSLMGFWKKDTLAIEDITPGTFPDIVVQVNGSAVFLKWETAMKPAVAYFDIQRSTDLKSWIKLSTLFPLATGVYEYVDSPPMDGIIYYRVRMIDSSGQEKFSNVNAVNINGDDHFLVWPNPVHDRLFIQTHFATGSIEVVDMAGRLIRKEIIHNTITAIPVNTISSGVYALKIKYNDEFVFSVNFIKE